MVGSRRFACLAILTALLGLAFGLRLFRLDTVPLRGDEAFAVRVWADSPATILRDWFDKEPHPLGTFLGFWAWKNTAGDSEFAMRYLALLGNLIGVAAVAALARRLFRSSSAALLAALLWAINPFLIWHAQDARNYAIWSGLSPLALWLFLRAVASNRPRDWTLYVLAEVIALYTFFLEAFFIVVQAIYLLISHLKHKTPPSPLVGRGSGGGATRALFVWLVIGILLIPWFAQIYLLSGSGYEGTTEASNPVKLVTWFIPVLLGGEDLSPPWDTIITALWTGFFALTLWTAIRHQDRTRLFLVAWIVTPALLLLIVGSRMAVFHPRYLIALTPALLLAIVSGVTHIARKPASLFPQRMAGVGALLAALRLKTTGQNKPHLTENQVRQQDHLRTKSRAQPDSPPLPLSQPNSPSPSLAKKTHTQPDSSSPPLERGPGGEVIVRIAALLIPLIALTTLPAYYRGDHPKAANWPALATYLEARAHTTDEIVTVNSDPAFSYYYSGGAHEYSLRPGVDISAQLRPELNFYDTIWLVGRNPDVEQFLHDNMQIISFDEIPGFPIMQFRTWEPDPAEMQFESDVTFGDIVHLRGYTIQGPDSAMRAITVLLYWEPIQQTEIDYKVFVHLIGPPHPGPLWDQDDARPLDGFASTREWTPGTLYRDSYHLLSDLSTDLAPGEYAIQIGFYDPDTDDRLPVFDGNRNEIGDSFPAVRLNWYTKEVPYILSYGEELLSMRQKNHYKRENRDIEIGIARMWTKQTIDKDGTSLTRPGTTIILWTDIHPMEDFNVHQNDIVQFHGYQLRVLEIDDPWIKLALSGAPQ